ncbi:MAG: hypothetical protein IPH78_13205 [Bacteroidetes bacterium]|nr:hypothetical protein [Bacteroidota bacterium]
MSTTSTSKTAALKGGEFVIKESQWQDVYIPEEITEEQTCSSPNDQRFYP